MRQFSRKWVGALLASATIIACNPESPSSNPETPPEPTPAPLDTPTAPLPTDTSTASPSPRSTRTKTPTPSVTPTGTSVPTATPPATPTSPQATPSSSQGTPTPKQTLLGWTITVYYTAVESFHTGAATSVSGCLNLDCTSKGAIGSYPKDFVQAVKDEGTGRITSGSNAGKYLNWSYDVGYWLDTAPRNSHGGSLVPFVSAAADASVLTEGVTFKVLNCGTDDSGGGAIDTSFCNQLKQATWKVEDEFTPGLGGSGHLDLYIGEEDQPNFTAKSVKVISTAGATIGILSTPG